MPQLAMLTLALLTFLSACADLESGRPEVPPFDGEPSHEGATTSVLAAKRKPSAAPSSIELPSHTLVELTRAVPRLVFSFVLTSAARVAVRTLPGDGLHEVDTVLSLAHVAPDGRRRWVAHNDDLPGTLFSGLVVDLPAARYELTVRGFSARALGAFHLDLSCQGGDCKAAQACPFGEQFSDLRSAETIEIVSEVWRRAETELESELERAQVVEAVRQSSHTDVASAAEALSRVDQQEVRRMELIDHVSRRAYVVYEYGVGDNSYGAIFVAGTLTLAASIHDGDLLACTP